MKKLLYASMLILISIVTYAQSSSNSIFRQGDKIQIELSDQSDYFYLHEIQKGHNFYTLSNLFNIPLKTLYRYNQLTEGSVLSIGQKIKIPLNDNSLFKGVSLNGLTQGHFIPVYYKTQPKDNLFRISRVYFNQPTGDLVKRNKLENNNLDLGQDILIGWFRIDSANPVIQEEEFEEEFDSDIDKNDSKTHFIQDQLVSPSITSDIVDIDTSAVKLEIPVGFNTMLLGSLPYSRSIKEIRKSQVANWDDSMPDNGTVYVLHRSAIIDSYLEMYNPNSKRSVKAKVIGRIPYGAYTKDVCLVLSPRAAKQLNALDRRFKVEIRALIYNTIAD